MCGHQVTRDLRYFDNVVMHQPLTGNHLRVGVVASARCKHKGADVRDPVVQNAEYLRCPRPGLEQRNLVEDSKQSKTAADSPSPSALHPAALTMAPGSMFFEKLLALFSSRWQAVNIG